MLFFTFIQPFKEGTSLFCFWHLGKTLYFPPCCRSLTLKLRRRSTRTNMLLQFPTAPLAAPPPLKTSYCLARPLQQNVWIVLRGCWDLSLSNGGGWCIADADEITACSLHAQEFIRQPAKKNKKQTQISRKVTRWINAMFCASSPAGGGGSAQFVL